MYLALFFTLAAFLALGFAAVGYFGDRELEKWLPSDLLTHLKEGASG